MQQSVSRRVFTYVLAALAGVAGALLGWLVVGLLADLLLGLGGMSDREGYRAMVAFFTFGPFGGLAGLIAGIWLVLRYFGGYTGFARIAGRGALVVVGVAGAVALGLWAYTLSDDLLVNKGPSPQVKFELRLPANTTLPAELAGVSMDLNTDKNTMPAVLTDTHIEEGRPVIVGWSSSISAPGAASLCCACRESPIACSCSNWPRTHPPPPNLGLGSAWTISRTDPAGSSASRPKRRLRD